MAHSYSAQYPAGITVSPDAASFFESFYELSDTPGKDEEWTQNFVAGASLAMGSKSAQGHDAILELRRGMWSAVASRRHTIYQVYPFGSNSFEFMLRGRVEFQLKSGGGAQKDWAAHAKLVNGSDGKLKFEDYQVYLDSA